MKKTFRPIKTIGKLLFVLVFVAALALTVSWVASGQHRASAVACDAVGNVCNQIDTNDCVPNADHGCIKDCTPNSDNNCECTPNKDENCSDCIPNADHDCNDSKDSSNDTQDPGPQVLGSSTTADPTFQGK